MRRIAALILACALVVGVCPAFADAGDADAGDAAAGNTTTVAFPSGAIAPQSLTPSPLLADGTYRFDGFSSSTGMFTPNNEDGPAKAIVDGDEVVLVLDLYNPDKYDGLWLGKRSEAPADPYNWNVVTATMVPADEYVGDTKTWVDADGLVGDAGAEYKASRFIMYLTLDEFKAALADSGRFYICARRSPWSPSNPGKWMGSADNYLTLSGMTRESDSTDVPGEGDYATGTYAFKSFKSSTGMVTTNDEDAPATAVIKGSRVALVLDIYNPDKYDGLWAGKRSAAPADPYDDSVANASMVLAGDYAGDTKTWTDADGLVGEAGSVYKAARFVMVMGKDDFIAMIENKVEEDFYFAIRRSPWSPSNPGKWMGSGDHYFTFGPLSKVSRSTYVPGGFPDGAGDSALSRVKKLIDALPYDPYKVKLSDGAAIRAAEEAYGLLSSIDRLQLDVQDAANGVLTYGRTLECASWGLKSLTPVDDTTTLKDGTYTSQVTSTCEMGKSNSRRGYKFTVSKVVVKDGHATATLEHATASPDTVSMGGVVYAHVNTDEKAHSTFEVPIDLNSTFYLSQMAKNPTANTIAIPYEMTTVVDEANAVPDPEEVVIELKADEKRDTGLSSDSPANDAPAGKSKASKKPAPSASSTPSVQRESAEPPVVVVTRQVPGAGSAGGSSGSAEAGGAGVAVESPLTETASRTVSSAGAEAVSADAGEEGRVDLVPYAGASAVALACLGAAAFVADYLRRDRRAVSVRGVRLTGSVSKR